MWAFLTGMQQRVVRYLMPDRQPSMRFAFIYLLAAVAVLVAGCTPALVEQYGVRAPELTTALTATTSSVAAAARPTATSLPQATVAATPHIVATETAAPQAAAESAGDAALIERGMQVYRQQYCGICHVLDLLETRGTFGPPHNGLGAIAAERVRDAAYTGSATMAAEYIRESIVAPDVFFVEGYAASAHRMPPYSHLDPADVDALVALLLSQR